MSDELITENKTNQQRLKCITLSHVSRVPAAKPHFSSGKKREGMIHMCVS